MAYNSDGYIMIDFTDVDFRRTNQTIEGLYKRCVDVIGTNKFILVINANGRTPLPATCSFTNNQYVIDTCIYMFAISSNDNLFIRRNDVPASDIIDDSSISVDKTWSSNKIDSELDTKADASALADYQPLLTPGTNITIDENNVISSTGGAVIDDSVIVNNKVWSSLNTVEKLAPINTIVNNPAVFNTSLALPLVECSTSFIASQEGSGTVSPTNPRPFVPVTNVILTANADTVTANFGADRYGGNVDFVNKKLNNTHIKRKISECSWLLITSGWFQTQIAGVNDVRNDLLTDYYKKVTTYNDSQNVDMSIYKADSNRIFIHDSNFSDATSFVNAMGDYGFVVQLTTPIVYDLSDIPTLSTIMGNNSFESDTGSIKVSYKYLPEDLF